MSYRKRIETLTESVRLLITQLKDDTLPQERRTELNTRKSEYEGEIRRLTRLQWEEDTQRVDVDVDDRC